MKIEYQVIGQERKHFAQAIAEATGGTVEYRGAPTFAYSVGEYTIDKEGNLNFPDNYAGSDELIVKLQDKGYQPMGEDFSVVPATNNIEAKRDDVLAVGYPRGDYSDEDIERMRAIVNSKASVLKKVFNIDEVAVEADEDEIKFPWFPIENTQDELEAYLHLVSAIGKMAKDLKRVTAKDTDNGNDKYTMRMFLIRLGFNGNEYKKQRQILTRNLEGNGAWRLPPEKNNSSEN